MGPTDQRPAERNQRLTDALARRLRTPDTGNRITYDGEVKGFGLRITAAGAKAFILNYRCGGRERRITIGAFPDWSVAAARKEAQRLRALVDQGRDPLAERDSERTAPTVSTLCARYLEDHLPRKRPSSQRDDRSMIERDILPALGRRKVADVRFADVDHLHRTISRRAPIRANRVVALLSKMFSLAMRWGWRPDSPVRGIERNLETKRQRYLPPAEIARLSDALNHRPGVAADIVRWLLLTGCRFSEAANAHWQQFDLEAGTWTRASHETKQKKTITTPLSAPARALLANLHERNGASPHVFPGPAGRPVRSIKTAWATICRDAGLEGVRVHDLRHSFAALLVSSGASLVLIGKLLGHSQAQTTNRYAHADLDPLREAAERVGAVVTGQPMAEVVQLRKGGA
jgi:integrase